MRHGAFAQTKTRNQDLDKLIDYRKYRGVRNTVFEDNFLTPRLQALGYAHVRFFGGSRCEYDGSFRERVCELARPGSRARPEYFTYG